MTTTDPAQTTKYVFDFSEGDKDQKDLLGGKGANLAEMVKLGLPVPPGFTISTEACRAYLEAGTVPPGWTTRSPRTSRRWRRPREEAGRPGRPAAGVGAVRGEVLHAGDDGDGPEHRAERRIGPRAGGAVGQPAVRVGLLPAADPDVRQDRAAHRRRAVRARAGRAEGAQGRPRRPRSGRRRPGGAGRGVPGDRARAHRQRLPAGPARAAGGRRSTRCSRRGTPTAPCSTGARSGSRTTWAPR